MSAQSVVMTPGLGLPTSDGFSSPGADLQGHRDRIPATCGGCTTTWPMDSAAAHCPTCHLTFRSASGFDDHRRAFACLPEGDIRDKGFEPDESGLWRQPRPVESLPERAAL